LVRKFAWEQAEKSGELPNRDTGTSAIPPDAAAAAPFHDNDARLSLSLPPPHPPGLKVQSAECTDGMVAIGIFELRRGARCDYVVLQRQIERGSFPFDDQSTVTFADQCRENGPC
jgi:hypothetical protein